MHRIPMILPPALTGLTSVYPALQHQISTYRYVRTQYCSAR
jgi:hypothetical protein